MNKMGFNEKLFSYNNSTTHIKKLSFRFYLCPHILQDLCQDACKPHFKDKIFIILYTVKKKNIITSIKSKQIRYCKDKKKLLEFKYFTILN